MGERRCRQSSAGLPACPRRIDRALESGSFLLDWQFGAVTLGMGRGGCRRGPATLI